jgi:hypothetical protein
MLQVSAELRYYSSCDNSGGIEFSNPIDWFMAMLSYGTESKIIF